MEYTLKLRLSENVHSDDNGYNTNETDPFKNKSNLNTKKGRNAPLETVCDALEGIIIEDNPQKNKTSLINIRRKCYKIVAH